MMDGIHPRTPGPFTWRAFGRSVLLHALIVVFFWGVGKILFRVPKEIIPIDMTIVPPWAEQTDDPDPDPNPPPKPEPEVKPQPKPPEPEPRIETKPVEAVEKVVEKKPEKINLRDKAKLVKTPIQPPKPVDLRDRAKLVDPPPNVRTFGKATAADKPLSPEEFRKLMNEGYRIGARNQIANDEMTRCASLIKQAIQREWAKENFRWYPGLQKIAVELRLGPGGSVQGFRICSGSGDGEVDVTAQRALARLRSIPGLSSMFLEQCPVIAVTMEPTSGM